jgi:phosphate uptake regulator
MTLRKLQRTGGGTFFVCLPKEWAERLGLRRGSIVSVIETAEGRLMIDPKYDLEPVPQVVTLEPSALLDREIVGKYLLGCDVIRIEAKEHITSKQRELVKQAVRRLVGLEIIEEDYKSIVMQCLLEPASLSPERILRREYNFAASMHRDAVTALIDGDTHLGGNVTARDDEVNRLYFLLVRILRTVIRDPRLSERLKISPIDCLDYRLVASFVEGIGDQSVQIAETSSSLKGMKLSEGVSLVLQRLHNAVFNAHEDALKALFGHDIDLAESIRNKRDEIRQLGREVETHAKNEQDVNIVGVVVSATASLGRIYELGVDIADLVMPKIALS